MLHTYATTAKRSALVAIILSITTTAFCQLTHPTSSSIELASQMLTALERKVIEGMSDPKVIARAHIDLHTLAPAMGPLLEASAHHPKLEQHLVKFFQTLLTQTDSARTQEAHEQALSTFVGFFSRQASSQSEAVLRQQQAHRCLHTIYAYYNRGANSKPSRLFSPQTATFLKWLGIGCGAIAATATIAWGVQKLSQKGDTQNRGKSNKEDKANNNGTTGSIVSKPYSSGAAGSYQPPVTGRGYHRKFGPPTSAVLVGTGIAEDEDDSPRSGVSASQGGSPHKHATGAAAGTGGLDGTPAATTLLPDTKDTDSWVPATVDVCRKLQFFSTTKRKKQTKATLSAGHTPRTQANFTLKAKSSASSQRAKGRPTPTVLSERIPMPLSTKSSAKKEALPASIDPEPVIESPLSNADTGSTSGPEQEFNAEDWTMLNNKDLPADAPIACLNFAELNEFLRDKRLIDERGKTTITRENLIHFIHNAVIAKLLEGCETLEEQAAILCHPAKEMTFLKHKDDESQLHFASGIKGRGKYRIRFNEYINELSHILTGGQELGIMRSSSLGETPKVNLDKVRSFIKQRNTVSNKAYKAMKRVLGPEDADKFKPLAVLTALPSAADKA